MTAICRVAAKRLTAKATWREAEVDPNWPLLANSASIVDRLVNDSYLRTAGDWNRRIVFSNTAAKPRI
jgi:hypothetical protein